MRKNYWVVVKRKQIAVVRMPYAILLFCFAMLAFVQIAAQDFQRLAAHAEAPQSAITAILQDKRGFLWFADENGLHRYDGRNFVGYRINAEKSSLENAVSALAEDSSGTLWLALGEKLCRFDRRSERIIFHAPNPSAVGVAASGASARESITAIIADKQGGLWLARESALEYHALTSSRAVQIFAHQHSRINTLALGVNGILWVGTAQGLEQFNKATGGFVSIPLGSVTKPNTKTIDDDDSMPDISVLSIGTDAAFVETIVVGSASGKVWRVAEGKRPIEVLAVGHRVLAAMRESGGQMWCATAGGGLFAASADSMPMRPFLHRFGGGRFFTAIFEDKQGIIWLGATDGSIYKLDRALRKFVPFKPSIAALPDGKNFLTLCIYEDSEHAVWLGTESGLLCYTPHNGAWRLFRHDKNDKNSLSSDNISCLYEDSEGTLWIGTTAGGLNTFDRKTRRFRAFRHHSNDSTTLGSDNISCIYEDGRKRLWIGTWINGLNLFDRSTQTFTQYRSNPQKISTLSSNSISCITEDRALADGTLWIGTYEDGLNAFHPTIQAFTRHLHDPANVRSLSSNAVSSVAELSDGTLWITTDAGLDKFDRRSQVFTRYGVQQGLPNEVLSAVVGDKRGNLWIMSAGAITKFTPNTAKAHTYDASDGLGKIAMKNDAEPEQFSSRAYFTARDGAIYFGTASGFVRFHPDSVRDNSYIPPVVITVLKKFNAVATLPVAIAEADTIELSYTDNFISFEFAALNYSASEKNRYKYKLDNFDNAWIDAGFKNEAVYTNLDGGEYTFRVIASNNDGLWNERGCSLTVIVHPPFWRTRWFYALAALFVVSGTWGGFRWRVRRLRARTEELKRLVEQRTAQLTASLQDVATEKQRTENHAREVERLNEVLNAHNAELAAQTRNAQLEMLRYQLNPHFLFNALISIADLVQEDAKQAVRALRTLMAYLRYALQPAGLPTVPLSEEVKAVQSYLEIEKVRFEERLQMSIDTTPEADSYYVPGFMLQPLVENAVKYGMRTSPMPLAIAITAGVNEHGALHLEVSNTGSLIIPEHTTKPEGTGTGLRNIRERLQVLFPERHEISLLEENGKVYVRIVLRPS